MIESRILIAGAFGMVGMALGGCVGLLAQEIKFSGLPEIPPVMQEHCRRDAGDQVHRRLSPKGGVLLAERACGEVCLTLLAKRDIAFVEGWDFDFGSPPHWISYFTGSSIHPGQEPDAAGPGPRHDPDYSFYGEGRTKYRRYWLAAVGDPKCIRHRQSVESTAATHPIQFMHKEIADRGQCVAVEEVGSPRAQYGLAIRRSTVAALSNSSVDRLEYQLLEQTTGVILARRVVYRHIYMMRGLKATVPRFRGTCKAAWPRDYGLVRWDFTIAEMPAETGARKSAP